MTPRQAFQLSDVRPEHLADLTKAERMKYMTLVRSTGCEQIALGSVLTARVAASRKRDGSTALPPAEPAFKCADGTVFTCAQIEQMGSRLDPKIERELPRAARQNLALLSGMHRGQRSRGEALALLLKRGGK